MDSSLISVTQLRMAPDRTPEDIMGSVTVKNALGLELPSDRAASSTYSGICCRMATEERMV